MAGQWSENDSQWLSYPAPTYTGLPDEGDVKVGVTFGESGDLVGTFIGEAHYTRITLPDDGGLVLNSDREGVSISVDDDDIQVDVTGTESTVELDDSDDFSIEVE